MGHIPNSSINGAHAPHGAERIKMIFAKSIKQSLKEDYKNGIPLEEIAKELYRAGWFNYIPSEEQTKKWLEI